MLKGMRKNTKLIIWMVILSFALWGGFSVGVQFQKKGRVAGEIFGKDVTFQEYNRFYKSQMIFFMGGETAKDPEVLKQQTWESLIYSHAAKRMKIEISDEEVRNEVLRLLAQQKMENASVEVYREWLRANVRETPEEFESQIRELLRIRRMVEQVKAGDKTLPATEKEALERFKLEQNQLSAEIIKFKTAADAKKFTDSVKTDKDWKAKADAAKLTIEPTGMITLLAWLQILDFKENDMNILLNSEKNSVHGPMSQGQGFAAVKILDNKLTPKTEFQKTFKDKYIQEINERKKYEYFMKWHQNLLLSANPKDYLPGSPSPKDLPPAKTAS